MYMKKRIARRSRNAAARKSLSQNMIDTGIRSTGIEGGTTMTTIGKNQNNVVKFTKEPTSGT